MTLGSHDDERAIARLLATYTRCLDDGRFTDLAELFAEDGVLKAMNQEVSGRSAIEALIASGMEMRADGRPSSMHVLSNCLIDVDGDDATAESDWVYLRREGEGVQIALAGRYRDRLARNSRGDWQIVEKEASPLSRPPRSTTT